MMQPSPSFRVFALALVLAISMTQGFDIRELYGKVVQGSVSKGRAEGGEGGRQTQEGFEVCDLACFLVCVRPCEYM